MNAKTAQAQLAQTRRLMHEVLQADITEAYDQVEALTNRVSVGFDAELRTRLMRAKNELFEARLLCDNPI